MFQTGSAGIFLDHLFPLNCNGGSSGLEKTSLSCPADVPQIKPEPVQYTDADLHAIAKDRQKKDNHNMSTIHFMLFNFLVNKC